MQTTNPVPLTAPARRTLVVMGVSGCGKTDISQAVASELDWRLIEADAFHPSANVERMRAGIPLDDDDRREWLDLLAIEMQAVHAAGEGFVLACSALKRSYRERLRAAVPGLQFAYLAIDYPTALQRVGARPGHFMPTSLVDNQFALLEAPDGEPQVLSVNAAQSRAELTAQICAWVRRDLVEQPTADAAKTSRDFERKDSHAAAVELSKAPH